MASRRANTREQRVKQLAGEPDTRSGHNPPNSEAARRLKAWRQNLVAQLVLTGTMTLEDIREYLMNVHGYAISGGQLSKDIKQMRERWAKQSLENTDTAIRAELNKLAELEQTAIQGIRDGGKIVDFVDSMLKIAKRRSSLLGLDKAKKLEVKHGLESLSDEELEATIRDESPEEAPDADVE